MKKLLLLTLTVACLQAKAQFINLPDSNFRNAIKRMYPSLINNLGQLDTIGSMASNIISLNIGGTNDNPLTLNSIKGIKYFKSLKSLSIFYTTLDSILELPNSLFDIAIQYNQNLTYIDKFPSNTIIGSITIHEGKLQKIPTMTMTPQIFICTNNLLDSLSSLPNSITILGLSSNKLKKLPELPTTLADLRCQNNLLDSLPKLPNTIQNVECNNNNLTKLPILPPVAFSLNCDNNKITSINNLTNGITALSCNNNLISGSITPPTSLRSLSCKKNTITTLPSIMLGLNFLNCDSNQITQLPSNVSQFTFLSCKNNKISSFPPIIRPNSLQRIYISSNELTSFPSIVEALQILDCSNNKITALPKFVYDPNYIIFGEINCSRNLINSINGNDLPSSLISLNISNNPLSSISNLPNNIKELNCNFNKGISFKNLPDSLKILQLIKTEIQCLPKLPLVLNSLYMDSSSNKCLPNLPQGMSIYKSNSIDSLAYYNSVNLQGYPSYSVPPCNPTNNPNNCASFPNIVGSVYIDENNNNTKDPTEHFRANVPVQLKANNKTVTNANGTFVLMADSIGSQTLTVIAPRFYTAVPSSVNLSFGRYDTLVNVPPIALQKTISKDSLAVKITPIMWAARPGFPYPFLVQYENVGSNTVNANINLTYNTTALDYDSSSTTVTPTVGNLQLMRNSFTPGSQGAFLSYFKVKPSASLLGTNLKTWASISGGTALATDTTIRVIGGSYDPNDKLATPQLTTTQVAEGQFINYTIRFQNTGTDTAFTVVIADTLNSLLQANTFEMLGSSHTCKTIIQDNKIYFEFRNILLPDSTTNLIGSNGFVNFRIKPISSVALNTSIPNKAAIYFDYNEPIITNTASTLISNTILPLQLVRFTVLYKQGSGVLFNWETKNEQAVKEFVVEESKDAINFKALQQTNSKGNGDNNYYSNANYTATEMIGSKYYRLKTVSSNGNIGYSQIVKLNFDKSIQPFIILQNPVKGSLQIQVNAQSLNNTEALLINQEGKVMQRFKLQLGSQTISLTSLGAGVYTLKTKEGSSLVVVAY